METTEKTLSETLKLSPWQLEVRLQHIHTRMRGQNQWAQGCRHYRCEIWRVGFGHPQIYTFEYSQGSAHTKGPSMADLMWCLLLDASIAQNYSDMWEMVVSHGDDIYTEEAYQSARATYEACEEVKIWLEDTFSGEELEQLQEMFEDY